MDTTLNPLRLSNSAIITPLITQADLARSLQTEPLRHVIVEVHDDQGESDNAEAHFGVLCLNDTFLKFIEQRSAVLKGLQDQLKGPYTKDGSSFLVQHLNSQAGFVRWGNYLIPSAKRYTKEERESPERSDHWEIAVDSNNQAVLIAHHANGGGCHSTGISVDQLSSLGRTPETSYMARDDMRETLAAEIRDYFAMEVSARSTVDLDPLIRQVHAAIAAAENWNEIEPLDDLDGEDTQENAGEAAAP